MSKWKLTTMAALVAAAAAAPLAQADTKPKYTRTQDVKINVNLSERSKPIQPKAKDPSENQPALSADQVLNVEGLVGDIRIEEEAGFIQLIKETSDNDVDEKADLYFRLGELYAKQQRYYRLRSAEAQLMVDKARLPADKAKNAAAFKDASEKTKTYMLKAVKVYQALTSNDKLKNYAKMDMALFYYGYTLTSAKYMKEARSVYDQLLKNYPQSKYVPEAHLAFADYFFEQNQLADAEARYKMVLKFPKSQAYWYAYYKLGWVDLNLQKYQDALETFFKVAQNTANDPKNKTLNAAAKKDFVRAYAEVGKADQALNAFKRVDQKYALDMLAILADLYLDQGKSDKAIFVFRELMKQEPTNKNVCLWQDNVARAMMSMPGSSNNDKIAEIENLVKLWGAIKPKKVLPPSEAQECHDNAAAMSGELARAYHSESAKTKNPETLAYAEKLYKVYLEVFPDAEDYAQTQYFYSELLWSRAENEKNPRLQTELWENAAVAFTDVVKTGKVGDKLMKESAYAAVLGWKNALNVDPRAKQQADLEDAKADTDYKTIPEPKPIPERDQKMLAAFDIYIKYIKDPKDDELVAMKFLKANLFRRYNHFDEAIPLFMDILDHHRDHETAEYSAQLLLDTYNRLHKYDEMLALADKLDADKKFLEGKDTLKTTIETLKAQSLAKRAEHLEQIAKDSKDFTQYVACGQAYLDIYNRNPEDKGNDVILYNAGVCFEEGKSIGAAINMYNRLQKEYPKSKQTAHAVGRLGKVYGDIAFYDRASEQDEIYAKNYAAESDAAKLMGEAVFFQKGIGNDQKAIDDTKYFIKTFGPKNPGDAATASFALTSIYEKQGDNDAVIKHLREYLHDYGEKGGIDRVITAHAKIGTILWNQSCPVKLVDGSCVKVTRERAIASKKQKHKKGADIPLQCGPESKIKLSVVKRDDRKLHEAEAEFKAVTGEWDKHQGKISEDPLTQAGARYFYAQVKNFEADQDFEKYLDSKFPTGLNFDPNNKAIAAKSTKRFGDWFTAKQKLAQTAADKYAKVLDIKDQANSVEAAARLGQITQEFSDQLFTAEIPANVRTGEFAEDASAAFCDALTEKAQPLEDASLDKYGFCLQRSTELGWFSDWSKLCERELGQIKPDQFPTASELHGDPNGVAPVISAEPPAKLE